MAPACVASSPVTTTGAKKMLKRVETTMAAGVMRWLRLRIGPGKDAADAQ